MTQFLQNAVYGTALILAVALLRRALKDKLAPGARLALWAVCLFRLLTPAAPASVLSLWGLLGRGAQDAPVPAAPAPNGAGTAAPSLSGVAPPAVNPAPAPAAAEFPWETVLLGAWLAVGAVLAVRYALSYVRTRRAVGCAIPVGQGDPRYAPLPRCARLREGPMDGAPLTFGAVRPTVVLSPGLDGAALECVLAHEAVHARRRDNLWHYVMAAALVAHWWNPAVWLMARLLRRDVELSCDRAALKALGADRRADYANALVSMATAGSGPAFCQTFGRKAAEERILSIMKYKKMTAAGVALTLALVFAVTAGFASDPVSGGKNGDVFYKDEDGSLVKIDPDTVVNGFVFDAAPEPTSAATVTKDGMIAAIGTKDEHGYIRESDSLSGQFEALYGPINTPEDVAKYEEWRKTQPNAYTIPLYDAQGNVIGEFAMTNPWGVPVCTDEACTVSGTHWHENGEVVHFYWALPKKLDDPNDPEDSAGAGDEPICNLPLAPNGSGDEPIACPPEESKIPAFEPDYDPKVEDGLCGLPTAEEFAKQGNGPVYPVCPVEGCTARGHHDHDGVMYSCNGHGHQGGVCDGTCYTCTGLPLYADPASAPTRTNCYPDSDSHHSGGHHGNHHN